MYSNNILNFQESTTILDACTKKSGNLLNAPRIYSKNIIRNFTNSEMDIFTPEYSLKHISHPSYHAFQLALTEKLVDFVKRLGWNHVKIVTVQKKKKEVYNLKSQNTPPDKLLDLFEADLFKLIRKVKFRRDYNSFQKKLNKDMKVKSCNCIWVRVDKSKNMYKIKPCLWRNGYHRRNWTQRHEFKSWTDCISHSTNTLGKGMNPIILPPAMGK